MYYVTENGQNLHFTYLFKICEKLEINERENLKHVKFGRIHKMSTRKGEVVFLKDILDEAMERCYESQKNRKTTRVSLNTKDIADIIGVSAVIVNDLKHNRLRDYVFSWDEIFNISSTSGVNLQYCHSRLHSLSVVSGITAATECDPEALLEPQAVDLIVTIAKFEEILLKSNFKLQPCTLLYYLFQLSSLINKAFYQLKVKNEDPHVASQRLLMFNKAKQVIKEGLKLLGLKPLNQM